MCWEDVWDDFFLIYAPKKSLALKIVSEHHLKNDILLHYFWRLLVLHLSFFLPLNNKYELILYLSSDDMLCCKRKFILYMIWFKRFIFSEFLGLRNDLTSKLTLELINKRMNLCFLWTFLKKLIKVNIHIQYLPFVI